eukprot:Gb_38530 [translate_table: standard]
METSIRMDMSLHRNFVPDQHSSQRTTDGNASICGTQVNCGHDCPNEMFRLRCQHDTGLQCLKSRVQTSIRELGKISEPAYQHLISQFVCPEKGCGKELSLVDLVRLVDISTVQAYQHWLCSTYDKLYRPVLYSEEIDCISGNHRGTFICTKISFSGKTVNVEGFSNGVDEALELRGFKRALVKNDGEYSLINSNNSMRYAVCIKCGISRCAACGTCFQNGKTGMHICRQMYSYRMYEIILNLVDLHTDTVFKSPKRAPKIPETENKTVWAPGTGFGGGYEENYVYSDEENNNLKESDGSMEIDGFKEIVDEKKMFDNRLARELASLENLLRELLEDIHSDHTSSACALLGWENILSKVFHGLAVNDCLTDICRRESVYRQFGSLLRTISRSSDLLLILTRFGPNVSNSSFLRKMEKIYTQCKIFQDRVTEDFSPDDIEFVKDLMKCYEELTTATEQLNTGKNGQKIPESEQTDQEPEAEAEAEPEPEEKQQKPLTDLYKDILKPLQFQFARIVEGEGFNDVFYGTKQVQSIDNEGIHNRKRMLHITREIATLYTSLPLEWESSIHVRLDETRTNVLKALIVGPKDTPYQNGIFIFDLCLPPDYPHQPPRVHFLTTGGGTVRFNPNLYANGTVCLSLLGTWSGPGWRPGESTLLEVLVSLQSFIFVKDPFYNEPGFELQFSERAKEESDRHRKNTLEFAILGALQKPDVFFQDVIRQHFLLKSEEILQQCQEWLADAPENENLQNTVQNIGLELAKLGKVTC